MNLKPQVLEYATRLGDDSLILGHRLSEWCSNAPFLEEELALANVALDYIGRARLYYSYAATLDEPGTTEDDFAFSRHQRDFSNLLINELPKGDFAYTMLRQLFIDQYNMLYLPVLAKSENESLAGIAEKAIKETTYHLRRSHEWTLRLGLGTGESHRRAQTAIDELWGYTHEMFDLDEIEIELVAAGIGVDSRQIKVEWESRVKAILDRAELNIPDEKWEVKGGRQGYHTEYLGHLLTEMQSVHRAYPGLEW